jgi:hypothetical protein
VTDPLDSATTVRLQLLAKGYSPIPLQGKVPAPQGWQTKHGLQPDEVRSWPQAYPFANDTGNLARDTPGLDIDFLDPAASDAVADLVREEFEERGYVLIRIGQAPKRLIPFRTDAPFKKIKITFVAPNGAESALEFLGDGQQYVVAGIHPNTRRPYTWHGGLINEIDREELPYVNEDIARRLLDKITAMLTADFGYAVKKESKKANGQLHKLGPEHLGEFMDSQTGRGVSKEDAYPEETKEELTERIAAALAVVPSDDYETWYEVGAALRKSLGEDGFVLFDGWSKKSQKYDAKIVSRKWKDVGSVTSFNVNTVFDYADKANKVWRNRAVAVEEEIIPDEPDDPVVLHSENVGQPEETAPPDNVVPFPEKKEEKSSNEQTKKTRANIFYSVRAADNMVTTKINEKYALVIVGGRPVVMDDSHKTVDFLQIEAFEEWLAGQFVSIPKGGDKDPKIVPLSKYWRSHLQRRKYRGIEFAPGNDIRPDFYNLWKGFAVEPKQGDCSKFLEHLKTNVFGEHYEWGLAWFADIFQHPDKKAGTSIALRGPPGVGKTIVGETFGSLLGGHYLLVSDAGLIVGRFNSQLASLLLLQCDEAVWAGDHAAAGKLRDMATGRAMRIELKGKEAALVRNYLRMLFTGEAEWIIPASMGERRSAVFDVLETRMANHPYFAAIEKEMANGGREALLWHLLHMDISGVNLRVIPKTTALLDQKISTMTPEQSWWLDVLKGGELPWGCEEAHMCPKKKLRTHYLEHVGKRGVRNRSSDTTFGSFLAKYVPELTQRRRVKYWVISTHGKVSTEDRCYVFPTLEKCRTAFAAQVQQNINWVTDDDFGGKWEEQKWEVSQEPQFEEV